MDMKMAPVHETHPYNSSSIPADTKALIIGTAPPPRFSLPRPPHAGPKKGSDADFYYGSESNYLWLYLEYAAGEPIFAEPGTPEAAVEDTENLMQIFLQEHRIWMRDVLQTYRRVAGYESSSRDRHIDIDYENTTFLDFSTVLGAGPNIEKIVFTSMQAADWFFGRVIENGSAPDSTGKYRQMFVAAVAARKKRTGAERYTKEFCTAELGGRTLRFFIAPSPSGLAWGPDTRTCIEIYRSILFAKD